MAVARQYAQGTLAGLDVSFGNEAIMREAEERDLHFLTKLRLTANVKKLINRLIARGEMVDAGQGFTGAEAN